MTGLEPFDDKNDFDNPNERGNLSQKDFPLKEVIRKYWYTSYTSIVDINHDVEQQTKIDEFTIKTSGGPSDDSNMTELLNSISLD